MATTIEKLQTIFEAHDALEIAVLVGSQADGTAQPNSDWDIALRWTKQTSQVDQLMKTEKLRPDLTYTWGQMEDFAWRQSHGF